jgi:hypothetical protein
VCGCDQVDVVASPALEGEHHVRQVLAACLASLPNLTYGVILAEDAVKVAVGEEDRS